MNNKVADIINQLSEEIYANNTHKGFHGPFQEHEFGTWLMLVVSELGEAIEADRKGRWAKKDIGLGKVHPICETTEIGYSEQFEKHLKDTVEDELADAIIRLLDISANYGINIGTHIQRKLEYNTTRSNMHGKQY